MDDKVQLSKIVNVVRLPTDHLGGTAYTVGGTAETGEVRYKAFGATRFTSGTTPTSVRFTGQREEASLGLHDYGARWYGPALGQFLSPDTLVADTNNLLDHNRYMYARGNPLKYTDPSGHVAICFEGGAAPDVWKPAPNEEDTQITSMNGAGACRDAYEHLAVEQQLRLGTMYFLRNNAYGIGLAEKYVREAKDANPNEPVVVLGYSWGGPASFALARNLDQPDVLRGQESVDVDLMLLLDPEFAGRERNNPLFLPPQMPENVTKAIYFKAQYTTASLDWVPVSGFQDGAPMIQGALRIDLAAYVDVRPYGESIKLDHQTIVNTMQGREIVRKQLVSMLSVFLAEH